MKNLNKNLVVVLGALLVPGFIGVGTAAEMMMKPGGFPQHPITIIVPYGKGGGSDQLTRAMASAVEKIVGAGIEVVNKPGGGGRAAIADFMAAPRDGYTVMEHLDDAATLYASGKVKENPAEDWAPLAIAQVTFSQLYARPGDDRLKDWTSFLNYAKANPGKVTIANAGDVASMERVNMLLLERELGFQARQVSFDDPADRYGALIGGRVDMLFEQPGDVRSFLDAGTMKPILSFLKERPSAFAQVPSLKDAGVKFEPLLRFRGFFAHKDVAKDRLKYLEWAFAQGYYSSEFQEFNRKKYMHLIDSYRNSADGREMIRAAVATYTKVYKEIGLIK